MEKKRTRVLFVDDDEPLLMTIRQLMGVFAGDAWEIHTAQDTARGLALLREQKFDLMVLDVHMPVVDGLQFLKLLQRKYPDVLKVVLTGDATGAYRAACLGSGAELFLEKPCGEENWQGIFATLHELTRFQPEEVGFRGVLRKVGLQDVLQMECMAKNSSLLEVATRDTVGKIFILDGQIVHTEVEDKTGEEAFYRLLSLNGGEFKLKPFVQPPRRTISDSWESLLMEAARKRDEFSQEVLTGEVSGDPESAGVTRPGPDGTAELLHHPLVNSPAPVRIVDAGESAAQAFPGGSETRPSIDEVLICSAHGDVLYEWQCHKSSARINFLEFVSQKARQLAQGLPTGQFDRLEIEGEHSRVVTQIQSDCTFFLRASRVPVEH